jgi:hypothetical protein
VPCRNKSVTPAHAMNEPQSGSRWRRTVLEAQSRHFPTASVQPKDDDSRELLILLMFVEVGMPVRSAERSIRTRRAIRDIRQRLAAGTKPESVDLAIS